MTDAAVEPQWQQPRELDLELWPVRRGGPPRPTPRSRREAFRWYSNPSFKGMARWSTGRSTAESYPDTERGAASRPALPAAVHQQQHRRPSGASASPQFRNCAVSVRRTAFEASSRMWCWSTAQTAGRSRVYRRTIPAPRYFTATSRITWTWLHDAFSICSKRRVMLGACGLAAILVASPFFAHFRPAPRATTRSRSTAPTRSPEDDDGRAALEFHRSTARSNDRRRLSDQSPGARDDRAHRRGSTTGPRSVSTSLPASRMGTACSGWATTFARACACRIAGTGRWA